MAKNKEWTVKSSEGSAGNGTIKGFTSKGVKGTYQYLENKATGQKLTQHFPN